MKKNLNEQSGFTLGEAYIKLEEIAAALEGLRSAVTRVPTSKVAGMFNRISALLSEAECLKRCIKRTEYSSTLGGASLTDIKLIIETLESRIKFFSLVSNRTDLSEDTLTLIKVSVTKFQSTRNNLLRKHDEAIWEIELLE